MAKLFASWVPGYAFVAQGDTSGYREGFGVTFHLEAGQGDWFHAPIPTPVIVENERARLGQVIVLYSFPQTAALHSVHVWDGPNRISATDGLDLTGDHGAGMDGDNTFPVIHEGILWVSGSRFWCRRPMSRTFTSQAQASTSTTTSEPHSALARFETLGRRALWGRVEAADCREPGWPDAILAEEASAQPLRGGARVDATGAVRRDEAAADEGAIVR